MARPFGAVVLTWPAPSGLWFGRRSHSHRARTGCVGPGTLTRLLDNAKDVAHTRHEPHCTPMAGGGDKIGRAPTDSPTACPAVGVQGRAHMFLGVYVSDRGRVDGDVAVGPHTDWGDGRETRPQARAEGGVGHLPRAVEGFARRSRRHVAPQAYASTLLFRCYPH